MPSIRRELENTRTAQWHARGAHRSAAWADRMRDYAALRSVLADHAVNTETTPTTPPTPTTATMAGAGREPAVLLPGLLKLVAERAHYAGAEPVYRRYRDKQCGQQIIRWAGADPAAKPTPAFVAEAKIVGFWPYREDVIEVADEFDMPPAEWAGLYLRALAAWAADDRMLAAYHPATAPACVREDMAVLAAAYAPQGSTPQDCALEGYSPRGAEPSASRPAERLAALADDVVRAVLGAAVTPAGACDAVRPEVARLLAPPPGVLTARVLSAVGELCDRLAGAADGEAVVPPDQASLLRGMLSTLTGLLADSPASPHSPASLASRADARVALVRPGTASRLAALKVVADRGDDDRSGRHDGEDEAEEGAD
jgi:hypothetical protein